MAHLKDFTDLASAIIARCEWTFEPANTKNIWWIDEFTCQFGSSSMDKSDNKVNITTRIAKVLQPYRKDNTFYLTVDAVGQYIGFTDLLLFMVENRIDAIWVDTENRTWLKLSKDLHASGPIVTNNHTTSMVVDTKA